MEIEEYKLSQDKKGLLGFYRETPKSHKGHTYYHIHSSELSKIEIQIRDLLLSNEELELTVDKLKRREERR